MFEKGDPLSPLHEGLLLDAIPADPSGQRVGYTLLTTAERHQLLVEWNATVADYPHQACLQELFETQVEQSPDAVALVFEGSTLTYRELNKRANQLAHHLQSLGVRPETLVGVCIERSLEMVVGLLGILKAGGAYVPLDPRYPVARLAFMFEDAALSVLVTEQNLINNLPAHETQIICVDAREAFSFYPDTNPAVPTKAESLAYVIYTSGSTGTPKGVQISHRAVVNFLCSMQKTPGITAQDGLLAVTTLSFDIAGLEIFLPLISGAHVVIASRDIAIDAARLINHLRQPDITFMQATPTTWRLLIESGWQGTVGLKMLCGGEALSRDLAEQLLMRGAELWNMYGPTETTVWSTIQRVSSGSGPVLIGHPIANTQIYLLDERMQPIPIGVAGELHIGGAGLARGYLKRPELTEEKFFPNPFSQEPGSRLYKTGDLARYLSDGSIECLGRVDYQVKINGHRIELGEIEAALQKHPRVRECAVIAREDTEGGKRLAAYIVSRDKTPLTDQELRNFLKEHVPEYMLPPVFVALDTLPVTPNGKLDRKSLPAPVSRRPVLEQAYVAPRGELEHFL
ncbi:MAG: amino acid adenylation domain-containing protein, partial [Gammaproteobacteria bacterium]